LIVLKIYIYFCKGNRAMRLFEEYKLYETMWDESTTELTAQDFEGYEAGTTTFDICVEGSNKKAGGTYPGMVALDKILDFINGLNQKEKSAVGLGWWWDSRVPGDACGDTIVYVAAPSEIEEFGGRCGSNLEAAEMPIRDALGISRTEPNILMETKKRPIKKASLKEDLPATGYRVVLADYDTDDFEINVEFGMQDPDENEVVDFEYLLQPGQTRGDLVVYLSDTCGYTSAYVHDERPATISDQKRLSSAVFPTMNTGNEWRYYGSLDEAI
jgi:hypothetical protein